MKIALRNWKLFFVLAMVLGVLPARRAPAQPQQDDEFTRAQKIVERVHAGDITIEKAFADGLLTRSVLLAIVGTEKSLDEERGLWNPGEETYKWTGLLVEKYPEIFDGPMFLGYPARIRIAMFFFRERDPRGAEIMEKIIDELPREKPDDQILMAALYNLGNYYLRTGEYKKAITVSLKVLEFDIDSASQANILLGAARGAWAAGDKESANALYEQVIALGYGWATGHAHSDMAGHLIAEGKLEAARDLMEQPLPGLNGDQFRVVLDSQLAYSYMSTGEWDEARKWAQETVRQYEALANPLKNHGLESIYAGAKRLPETIDRAEKNSIELSTKKIEVRMPGNATQPTRTYVYLSSYLEIAPVVASDLPSIKTWMFYDPQGYSGMTKMIGVEIGPDILQRGGKAELTVTFKEFPDIKFQIPIEVIVTE